MNKSNIMFKRGGIFLFDKRTRSTIPGRDTHRVDCLPPQSVYSVEWVESIVYHHSRYTQSNESSRLISYWFEDFRKNL